MKIRLLVCFLVFISFRGYGQCTLSVTLTKSADAICSGNGVVLTATPSAGTPPFTYVWNTGQTSSSITVNKPGTYTVSVSDKTPGCVPVKKSIDIVNGTTPDAPIAKNVVVCANSSATLKATAPGGTYQWYDSNGNFLASGDTYVTPPITAATTYYVQTTSGGCTSSQTPVNVNLTGKPNVTGATVCAGNVATLMASGGDTYSWYDAASGGSQVGSGPSFITPPLNASKTYYVVVTSNGCTSSPTAVTAVVTQPPSPPTVTNQEICSGSSVNLHADAPAGIFDWFTTPTGGTSLISSPDYTTPPLTKNTTYYVQTSINDCVSTRVPVKIIVDSPPTPPDAQTDTICYKTSTTLTATANPSGTYKWYDVATGGTSLATGVTFTTPVLTSSTTYYVQGFNGACSSGRMQVNVIVNPLLSAPSVAGAIICSGATATLTATSSTGGVYKWYAAATGGAALVTGDTFTTPPLTASTTYYVSRTLNGCVSPRTAVTVSVLTMPAPPTAANAAVCAGNAAVLTANSPANIYAWYDSPTGGTLLSNGQVYVTPPLTATTIYYVETSNANGCTSTRKAVTVTVNPDPTPPTVSGTSTCPGTSATLTAGTTAGNTAQWFAAATGGTALATGNTYTTPVLVTTTTYYVQTSNGTCTSARVPVTVTVTSGYYPEFQYSSGTYCSSSPDQTPVINNPAGGTFSATPAGLVFVSTTTGEINIAASAVGKYTVTFANNAPCPGTSSAKLDIVTTPDATFSYNGPYCQGTKNPLPNFGGTGTPGTFTASPAGLAFINTSTGEIDLNKSNAGTYTVTNTIVATGTCPQVVATAMVTINSKVVVSAGPNQIVPTGSTVQLAGSITGGVTTGTWSGGTGTFSNPRNPAATYTPGPGEKVATLTLTSDDPPGICGPQSDKVVINFNNTPGAPVAAGTTVCSGSSATLSATAPGGAYQWYDAATSGTQLATGPSFKTPPLIVNTTYYVQTTVNGITSSRTPVTVTVNSVPAAPIAAGTQTCEGTPATLTASGATTYAWYDAAVGGNLLSTTNTYITSALSVNTSYYVQAQAGNCTSTRTKVDVTVEPVPNITSAGNGSICSGNALNYSITSDQPAATFTWSRAAVTGISNAAVTNQTTPTITETLINTGTTPISVTYVITATAGACTSAPFNYIVTVYPQPLVTGAATDTICNSGSSNYAITFNIPGVSFTWSRDAVTGISNAAVSGQASPVIREVLFNTTNAPINATYAIKYLTGSCTSTAFNLVVTVNPNATITSAATGIACGGVPQDYAITSNIPNATYSWSRSSAGSNPAEINQTDSVITETLVNTGPSPINITYTITPLANGCPGTPFKRTVSINPTLGKPQANSNSPVCIGSVIHLLTPTVPNATYLWTGPNGFTSNDQNPDIKNATAADTGIYTLVTMVRGCTSSPANVHVLVDEPSVAYAGPNVPQVVCISHPSVILHGTVTGGSKTGIWSTDGTGTFSPAIDSLNVQYIFSPADKAAGIVVLTLSSTSKDDCNISMSSVTIEFGPLPGVDAGPDQTVCSQDTRVIMNGKNLTAGNILWAPSSDASGTFDQPNQLNAAYIPTAADIKHGYVHLILTNVDAGECFIPADTMMVKFMPPPTVNAGGVRYVLRGNTITLNPTVSNDNVTYQWTPDIDISDVNVKNPVVTGDVNRFYVLTVTDPLGCVARDTTLVVVSPAIKVNNTFTPNGDGINDLWEITGLVAYTDATVDIFNRYGQKLFHSIGYPKAWDGTYNGKPVPSGVYYYIIDTKVNKQVLSGYVTVIR